MVTFESMKAMKVFYINGGFGMSCKDKGMKCEVMKEVKCTNVILNRYVKAMKQGYIT